MAIVENGYEIKPCAAGNLLEVLCDCIADVMLSDTGESEDGIVFPVELALGYSDKGGMGLAIGWFFITCDNSPPDRDSIIKIIKEAYKLIIEDISGLPMKIGEIKIIPSENEKECNLEVELCQLQ